VTAAAGLAVLLAVVAQLLARPADQGLLLTITEAAIGMGLSLAGFALMVVGSDPFTADDSESGRQAS
jgi:hypothetical protein